uniref:Transporter-like protein n=1 Tax=Zea mays TaxID=4577 RepID=B6TZ55_MAIZE|nr:transporter-like protein [Zea mays]
MSYPRSSKSDPTTKKQSAAAAVASEEQQAKMINEVRELLRPAEMPGFLTDSTVRRFLHARSWSAAQATKAVKETVKWRRQYRPDEIRWDDIPGREHEVKRAYIADYLDKDGRTVVVTVPAIKSQISAKEQVKLLVYTLESCTAGSENGQESVVWIADFRGWTLSSTPLAQSRQSMNIIQKHYPGLIAAAILFDPPKIFESFWKMLSYFIEPELEKKVKFVYTDNPESQRIMADMFDMEKLDSAFGGRSASGIDVAKYSERMRTGDQIRGLR